MALEQITFNLGALDDAANSGKNYVSGQVFEVFNIDDTYADIFADSAGTIPIDQSGVQNISNSDGECKFFIDKGFYNIKSGGKARQLNANFSFDFETVSDAVNARFISLLEGRRVYIEEREAHFDIVSSLAITPNGYDEIISVSNSNFGFKLIVEGGTLYCKAFGALADYSTSTQTGTDDTGAISRAIEYGGLSQSYAAGENGWIVHLCRGISKITSLPELPSAVSIHGYGSLISRLYVTAASGWAISTKAFVGNDRSFMTSLKGFQINGDPNMRVISNGSNKSGCGGIGLYSSLGCNLDDVRVYYVGGTSGYGLGFYTSQDIGVKNVDLLHNTNNIEIGFFDNDVSNAIHFHNFRSENAIGDGGSTGLLLKISGNPNQARQIDFGGCKFEGDKIEIDSCNGVTFSGGTSFVAKLVGEYMIEISQGASSDTRNITFDDCLFLSSQNKICKMLTATTGTNNVVVTNNQISSLAADAFDGDIYFDGNSLYDVEVPYVALSAKGIAGQNSGFALTRPALSANESSGVYSEVRYKASKASPQVLDYAGGALVNAADVTHNTVYKNITGQDIYVTLKISNPVNTGNAAAIQVQIGATTSLRSLPTMQMPSNEIRDHSVSFFLRAGWFFNVVASAPQYASVEGALFS